MNRFYTIYLRKSIFQYLFVALEVDFHNVVTSLRVHGLVINMISVNFWSSEGIQFIYIQCYQSAVICFDPGLHASLVMSWFCDMALPWSFRIIQALLVLVICLCRFGNIFFKCLWYKFSHCS